MPSPQNDAEMSQEEAIARTVAVRLGMLSLVFGICTAALTYVPNKVEILELFTQVHTLAELDRLALGCIQLVTAVAACALGVVSLGMLSTVGWSIRVGWMPLVGPIMCLPCVVALLLSWTLSATGKTSYSSQTSMTTPAPIQQPFAAPHHSRHAWSQPDPSARTLQAFSNVLAFRIGVIAGAIGVGFVCGLPAFGLALYRGRASLSFIALACCIVAGLVYGALMALPAGVVLTIIVLALPGTARPPRPSDGTVTLQHAPQAIKTLTNRLGALSLCFGAGATALAFIPDKIGLIEIFTEAHGLDDFGRMALSCNEFVLAGAAFILGAVCLGMLHMARRPAREGLGSLLGIAMCVLCVALTAPSLIAKYTAHSTRSLPSEPRADMVQFRSTQQPSVPLVYKIGVICGATGIGFVLGLVPSAMALYRRYTWLSVLSLACCMAAGLGFGLLMAIPASLVFMITALALPRADSLPQLFPERESARLPPAKPLETCAYDARLRHHDVVDFVPLDDDGNQGDAPGARS